MRPESSSGFLQCLCWWWGPAIASSWLAVPMPSNIGVLEFVKAESVEDADDVDDAQTLSMHVSLLLMEDDDSHEARPETGLLDDIRETVSKVLMAEQDRMQGLLMGFHMRQARAVGTPRDSR